MTVRLPMSDVKKIELCIAKGFAMSSADFMRSAIREKLVELDIQPEYDKQVQVVFGGE